MRNKNENPKVKNKMYDFTKCREEEFIGVFVESDLSKTVANYIYQHTSDIESAEFARELYHKGKVKMDEKARDMMIENIGKSKLIISVKDAVIRLLKEQ